MENEKRVAIAKVPQGKGLLSKIKFKEGDTIIHLRGKILSAELINSANGKLLDNSIRFSHNQYLSPDGELGDYINHSCSPNSKISKSRNQLFLVAVKEILKGNEITIDYSTILASDDNWKMKCCCGYKNCRGTIKKLNTLPTKLQNRYTKHGMIPKYILDLNTK